MQTREIILTRDEVIYLEVVLKEYLNKPVNPKSPMVKWVHHIRSAYGKIYIAYSLMNKELLDKHRG